MSDRNSYSFTALGRTYDVRRVKLDKNEDFTENVERPSGSDAPVNSSKSSALRRRPLLLPVSPFEVEKMHLAGELDKASWVTDNLLLTVDDLPVSRAEKMKDMREKALAEFKGSDLSNQKKYDAYTLKRFGKYHNALVEELKTALVERFKMAFDSILYVVPWESWRAPGAREKVSGFEIAGSPKVIREMLELAGGGHVHSQYLAALLLCFSEQGLTKRSVELLLQAHEKAHPQALSALACLLAAQREYIGAVQAALIAMQGGYPAAGSTVREVQRSLTTAVILTNNGPVPAFYAVLQHLDEKYTLLARKHFPEWFPSEKERVPSFLRRLNEGGRHV